MSDLREKISKWRDGVGFQFISRPSEDPIKAAMTLEGWLIKTMDIDDLGEHLVTLDSYYTYLSAEMGAIFSRVQYSQDREERVKLNQIKPLQEAVKVKIDLYKKIYDRKVREAKWRMNDSSSRG